MRAYPDFVDVLTPLAEAYTRRGLYEQGLVIDVRLTQLRGKDPLTWYNLACSYSLLRRIDESLEALRRSLSLGYTDVAYLQKDPDLLYVRQSPKYRQFLDTFCVQKAGLSTASGSDQPLPPATDGSARPPSSPSGL